jgi:hypothetical protein
MTFGDKACGPCTVTIKIPVPDGFGLFIPAESFFLHLLKPPVVHTTQETEMTAKKK